MALPLMQRKQSRMVYAHWRGRFALLQKLEYNQTKRNNCKER
jgi:hypothetical protein